MKTDAPKNVRARLQAVLGRDHTKGSLLASMLVLALPMILGSIGVGAIYPIVDLSFLVRLGDQSMASVVIVNQTVWQLVIMGFMGLNFATQSHVAQWIGAGKPRQAEQMAGQALLLAAGLGIFIALVGGLAPQALLELSGADVSFFPLALPYLQWLFVLAAGFGGVFVFRAILTGAGDTTTPLLVSIVQVTVSLVSEWVFIFGNWGAPELGVRGVALGMGLGQISATALGMFLLFRGTDRVRLRFADLRPQPKLLLVLLRSAWPPAVQMIGMVVSAFFYLRLARPFGTEVQTAYTIGLRLGMIIPQFSFPLATACATLVGQALGAGDVPRAWRAIRTGIIVHGGLLWVFAAGLFFFRFDILGLVTSDPEVIRIASEYLVFSAAGYMIMGIGMVLIRALQGAGDFIVPMVISLASTFLINLPAAWALSRWTDLGPTGIWWGGLLGGLFTLIATGGWVATGRWTRRHPRGPTAQTEASPGPVKATDEGGDPQ
ncbi:MAG: MATE family efflux transporter [bacterium]